MHFERINYNVPFTTGKEMHYIRKAILSGHLSGDGQYTKLCNSLLENELDVNRVLLTTSCTHALEIAALLLELKPGDEVVIPSFTFVSTANAFVLHGAKPVFVDIRQDTLNMDENLLAEKITSRTRAIVPVHYAGVGCDMESISATALYNNIVVIEDNAHGIFGKYKSKPLGSFGSMATLSFHETKNFQCGEGGALILNDLSLLKRAEIIREKGTDRTRFFRGEIDKYTWRDIGSSFIPSEILAAFLYAQLEERVSIQKLRKDIWDYYYTNLYDWAKDNNILLPVIPSYCEQSYHLFYLLLPSTEDRNSLIAHLKSRNIHSVFHYIPLHDSVMGRKYGGQKGDCPVTERVSGQLLRLPFFNDLNINMQSYIIDTITDYKCL